MRPLCTTYSYGEASRASQMPRTVRSSQARVLLDGTERRMCPDKDLPHLVNGTLLVLPSGLTDDLPTLATVV